MSVTSLASAAATAHAPKHLSRRTEGSVGGWECQAVGPAGRPIPPCSAGQRIVNRLRVALFAAVLKQEVAFFDKTRTGELVNRLSADAALLGRSVTENLSDGLRAVAQASVGTGMMVHDASWAEQARRGRSGPAVHVPVAGPPRARPRGHGNQKGPLRSRPPAPVLLQGASDPGRT